MGKSVIMSIRRGFRSIVIHLQLDAHAYVMYCCSDTGIVAETPRGFHTTRVLSESVRMRSKARCEAASLSPMAFSALSTANFRIQQSRLERSRGEPAGRPMACGQLDLRAGRAEKAAGGSVEWCVRAFVCVNISGNRRTRGPKGHSTVFMMLQGRNAPPNSQFSADPAPRHHTSCGVAASVFPGGDAGSSLRMRVPAELLPRGLEAWALASDQRGAPRWRGRRQ